jgi:hypothetical protein
VGIDVGAARAREAATGCGQADVANAAIELLAERARATGTNWALGLEARSRALQSERMVAERLHREAIDHLGRTRVAFELARARLLYGEWLRRERRRLDAREELRAAHDMFASMEAEAFAARAERELLATGETARKRKAENRDELTARRRRSRSSLATGSPTPRSVPSYSSALAPSSTTCIRCSRSSGSAVAGTWPGRFRLANGAAN